MVCTNQNFKLMKKIYLSIIVLFLSFSLTNAQTALNTAVDFTVTDLQGNSHNLFSILNSGKYVCLDFYFTTCPPCQQTCPYFKQTFTNYGCNTQDVYFMSIDNGDTKAQCETYETTFLGGAPGYPGVSGTEGGGDAVVSAYGITAFPTYILIAPDKSIVEKDMWPISSATDFTTFFSNHSLTQKTCLTGITETNLANSISLFPNPSVNSLFVETSNNKKITNIKVYDVLSKLLINQNVNNEERVELAVSNLTKGMYFMEILTEGEQKVVKKFNKE